MPWRRRECSCCGQKHSDVQIVGREHVLRCNANNEARQKKWQGFSPTPKLKTSDVRSFVRPYRTQAG